MSDCDALNVQLNIIRKMFKCFYEGYRYTTMNMNWKSVAIKGNKFKYGYIN